MLASYRKANKDFFEPRCAPKRSEWQKWVEDGLVKGKVIGDSVFIDLNWFAANDIIKPTEQKTRGIDLLT